MQTYYYSSMLQSLQLLHKIVSGSNQFSGFMDAPAGIVIACAIYVAEDDIRPNVIKPNIIADATKMLIIIVLQVIDIMLWY